MAYQPTRKKSRSTLDSEDGDATVSMFTGKPRLDELLHFAKTGKLLGKPATILTYGSSMHVPEVHVSKFAELSLAESADHDSVADEIELMEEEADASVNKEAPNLKRTRETPVHIKNLLSRYSGKTGYPQVYMKKIDGRYSIGKPYDLHTKHDYKGWTSWEIVDDELEDDIYKEVLDDGLILRFKHSGTVLSIGYYNQKSELYLTDRNKSYVSLYREDMLDTAVSKSGSAPVYSSTTGTVFEDQFGNFETVEDEVVDFWKDHQGKIIDRSSDAARKSQVGKQADAIAKVSSTSGVQPSDIPPRPSVVQKLTKMLSKKSEQ